MAGKGGREKARGGEEWKKLLRAARNCRIVHVPMEWSEWLVIFHIFVARDEGTHRHKELNYTSMYNYT